MRIIANRKSNVPLLWTSLIIMVMIMIVILIIIIIFIINIDMIIIIIIRLSLLSSILFPKNLRAHTWVKKLK